MDWVIFGVLITIFLSLDLFVFHKKSHEISFKEAALWSGIWIALALLFNVYVWWSQGHEAGVNFLTGYLVEKSLSVDNLFVFILVFAYFKTPHISLHRVLFYGILGAIFFRAIFIFLGVSILQKFHFIFYLLGAFLVITGIKFIFTKDREIHPEKNFILKLFRRLVPVSNEYESDSFFIRRGGKLFATPLAVVLLSIETSDVIFAIDSIPAILAITLDPFIVFTSNIFAILGLRSLFFVLQGSFKYFIYLHYGIAAILIFIGAKMLIADFIEISAIMSFTIIAFILALSILASLLLGRKKT